MRCVHTAQAFPLWSIPHPTAAVAWTSVSAVVGPVLQPLPSLSFVLPEGVLPHLCASALSSPRCLPSSVVPFAMPTLIHHPIFHTPSPCHHQPSVVPVCNGSCPEPAHAPFRHVLCAHWTACAVRHSRLPSLSKTLLTSIFSNKPFAHLPNAIYDRSLVLRHSMCVCVSKRTSRHTTGSAVRAW